MNLYSNNYNDDDNQEKNKKPNLPKHNNKNKGDDNKSGLNKPSLKNMFKSPQNGKGSNASASGIDAGKQFGKGVKKTAKGLKSAASGARAIAAPVKSALGKSVGKITGKTIGSAIKAALKTLGSAIKTLILSLGPYAWIAIAVILVLLLIVILISSLFNSSQSVVSPSKAYLEEIDKGTVIEGQNIEYGYEKVAFSVHHLTEEFENEVNELYINHPGADESHITYMHYGYDNALDILLMYSLEAMKLDREEIENKYANGEEVSRDYELNVSEMTTEHLKYLVIVFKKMLHHSESIQTETRTGYYVNEEGEVIAYTYQVKVMYIYVSNLTANDFMTSNQLTHEQAEYYNVMKEICKNNKDLLMLLNVNNTSYSKNSMLLTIGQTKNIHDTNNLGNENVRYETSDPNIVTVTYNGMLTGINIGYAIITVYMPETSFECTVTVVDANICSSAVAYAENAVGSRYDMNRRMEDGIYDCSSLVWKAYHSAGLDIISSSYAPCAEDIADWGIENCQVVSRGYIDAENLKPGDLIFYRYSDSYSGERYHKKICHVAMYYGAYIDPSGNGQNNGRIVHAAGKSEGVTYSTYDTYRRSLIDVIIRPIAQ